VRNPADRWVYGSLAVAFVLANVGIAAFGWTEKWQWMGLLFGIPVAVMVWTFLRYR
jgi:hypothetical protein